MPVRRIGIDFDNTLVCYDHVFLDCAKQRKLVPEDFEGGKQRLRDAIRLISNGEIEWQKLQGFVYSTGIRDAELFDGADRFLKLCRDTSAEVFIVSHKTESGHLDPERVNLRHAALGWMKSSGFFDSNGLGISIENIFFEATRDEKISRIRSLSCTHFIDDLEEVLTHPDFPDEVMRILFSQMNVSRVATIEWHRTWHEISEAVFK